MSLYIEFAVQNTERFAALQAAFNRIKADKDAARFVDDIEYLQFFDEQARAYFGWFTEEENAAWLAQWDATPVETRWTDESLKRPWSFGSMIDAFRDGEYELLECQMIAPGIARLTFSAWAFPYGGTGPMQALLSHLGSR
ncbi:MAG: YlbF family regulator [Chloroflexota bacterium]|nr:YlbF family regulator [Chloroflexota bacterium]